ncbi:Cytochrome P450 [Amycolatopsis xylanica]|uniref:Cytochrome P450 n=1 Tax=Amycolatopsis xylanica TaxID=589385 RepID=A0A1H2UC56_9PSEU|nr:Cytochrome P450 [Amycolatopsis xylanica]
MLRTELAPLPPGPRLPVAVQTIAFGNFRHVLVPLLRRRYGDVIAIRLYPERKVVQLANLEHIKTVFTGPVSTFRAGEGNLILKPLMGEHSVLLTDEDVHLRARKLLMPAFHGAALRGYRDLITELAVAEVERWPEHRPFRSHDRMRALTLEIILRVVFGVTSGPRLDELRPLLARLLEIGPLDIFGWHNPKLQRFGRWKRNFEVQQRIDELLYAEIAERRQASDLGSRADVLSRLLTVPADDDRLSDAELRDQLVTLLLAGHETTATALAWAFHDLARDPVEQAAARAAADDGDEKHLEAIAKEAMRLHPVLGEVARKLTEDIEIGGYRIPAGYTVMPSINMVQLDSAHHPDPLKFRPSRFLDGNSPPPGSWMPFGGGVRRCLGAGFSLLEATIVLQEVLKRFQLAPDRPRAEPQRPRNITMVPGRGARVSLTRR